MSLDVALIIRDKLALREREGRIIGLFSYEVPEFCWTHYAPGKGFRLDRSQFKQHDLIILEDGLFGDFGGSGPPVVGIFWDTNWQDYHYHARFEQAKQCDLVFIEQDPLERFAGCGRPVRRLSYCVNDRLFKDYGLDKDVDIAYHVNWKHSQERQRVHKFLEEWSRAMGYVYRGGPVRDSVEYARAFNRARISINQTQVPQNRPHRVFDVLASRSCLLTSPLPDISEEVRTPGVHYLEYHSLDHLARLIESGLGLGKWADYAEAGYRLSHHYTWRVRARELRRKIEETL